jgi:hypothetical protein
MLNTGVIRYNPIRDVLGASTSAILSTPMRELLEQGASAYQTGALDVAADRLSQAIRLNGELQGGYLALAICRARVGKYHDALRFLEAELRGTNPHPRAPQLKSDILTWLGGDGHKENAGIPITLFTIPKPFKGLIGTIQRNALKSWLKLSQPPEILILGNEEGTAEIAQELGLRHIPETALNEYGTPLISSIFQQAQSVASHDLMAYANTDIIFTETFTVALQALTNQERFLVVGRRWDIDSWEPMDFEASSWSEQVTNRAKKSGLLHGSVGIDYLIFRKGLYQDLPPFAVGRTAWDNWLIWEAKHQGAELIDATHAIDAFHQEHSYTHAHGGVKEVWNGAEALRNRELARGNAMTIQDADFCMEAGNIVRIHDGYRRPEPTQQDYANLKFRQSMAAYRKGQYAQALDLLEYIELNSNNCTLAASYYIHKAKVLQAIPHACVKETAYNPGLPFLEVPPR